MSGNGKSWTATGDLKAGYAPSGVLDRARGAVCDRLGRGRRHPVHRSRGLGRGYAVGRLAAWADLQHPEPRERHGWISPPTYWPSVIRGAFLALIMILQSRLHQGEHRMSRISTVTAGYYRVPLPVVLTDSTHGEITAFELVTVRVRDADGAEGTGYTYTVGRNGAAINTTVERDMADLLVGADADLIEQLWQRLWWAT